MTPLWRQLTASGEADTHAVPQTRERRSSTSYQTDDSNYIGFELLQINSRSGSLIPISGKSVLPHRLYLTPRKEFSLDTRKQLPSRALLLLRKTKDDRFSGDARDIDPLEVADALEAGKMHGCLSATLLPLLLVKRLPRSLLLPRCRPGPSGWSEREREQRRALQRRHRARPSGIAEETLCVFSTNTPVRGAMCVCDGMEISRVAAAGCLRGS